MFKDKIIEKRIMTLVKEIISEAQTKYDEAIEEAEEALEIKLQFIRDGHEQNKTILLDRLVTEAFAKLK